MKDDSQCVVVNMVVRYGDGMSEEHGPSHEEAAQSLRRVFASVVGDGALTEFSGHEVEVDEYGLEVSAVETSFSQVWSIGNENDLVSKVGIDLSDRQQINQRLAALGLTPVTDFLEMLSFPGPVSITDHPCSTLNAWRPTDKGSPDTSTPRDRVNRWLAGADVYTVDGSPLLHSFNETDDELIFSWVEDEEGGMREVFIPIENLDESTIQGNFLYVRNEAGEMCEIAGFKLSPHHG